MPRNEDCVGGKSCPHFRICCFEATWGPTSSFFWTRATQNYDMPLHEAHFWDVFHVCFPSSVVLRSLPPTGEFWPLLTLNDLTFKVPCSHVNPSNFRQTCKLTEFQMSTVGTTEKVEKIRRKKKIALQNKEGKEEMPWFKAPEELLDDVVGGPACDIWALGLFLSCANCLRFPFYSRCLKAIMTMIHMYTYHT